MPLYIKVERPVSKREIPALEALVRTVIRSAYYAADHGCICVPTGATGWDDPGTEAEISALLKSNGYAPWS